jgi:hypothetical protein
MKMAVFFLLLFLMLILLNHWMDYEPNPQYPLQYDEVFHPKVNADLVILGASQATHGINPKYLEVEDFKVFNFALNGAPPSFYLKWYNKIFRHYYRKPSYIIYAVHWMMFEDKIHGRRFENDSKYFPFSFFIRQFRNFKSLQPLFFNRFAFSKQRKQVLYLLFNKKRERYPRAKYYNGFIPFKVRQKLQKTGVVPEIDPVQRRAFEELLNDFERDGIKVIFVHTPSYLYCRDDQNISKNVQFLKGIAEKRRIPFLNYETERISPINTNPDLFADWTHMSEKGSEAFSKQLCHDLRKLLRKEIDRGGDLTEDFSASDPTSSKDGRQANRGETDDI